MNKENEQVKTETEAETETLKSKGLGDSIKKVTDKLGIKQCGGCKRRQALLNKFFPYK